MIYVTGDCHSDFQRFKPENFPEQEEMTKDDYVIICGDFGGIWYPDKPDRKAWWWDRTVAKYRRKEDENLDWLESLPFTTLFVDGNHSNFDRLYQFPVKDWNGGKVHEIRPSVLHLMRGEIFTLQDRTFWCFGGASSHDCEDGILEREDIDTIHEWDSYGKRFRINNLTWWKEELPTDEEMAHGRETLAAFNNKVDFIITHSPTASSVALLGHGFYRQDKLTHYLEDIRGDAEYTKWFFGHMHDNKAINTKDLLLYEQIIRIL